MGKGSCKGLSADVLHLRMFHSPERSGAAELTACESKAWFQHQFFYIKSSDLGSTEFLLGRKIHRAPRHETSTRRSPLCREPVLRHSHCLEWFWTWNKGRTKLTKLERWAAFQRCSQSCNKSQDLQSAARPKGSIHRAVGFGHRTVPISACQASIPASA